MSLRGTDVLFAHRRVEPVDLVHLADDDELVAIRAYRPVVVEAVAELRIAADHVRRLQDDARHRVVDAAAHARDLGARVWYPHLYQCELRICNEKPYTTVGASRQKSGRILCENI